MAIRCASCGEELLGAVNRCWRCGTEIDSHHDQQDLPPVRRPPIPQVVEADIVPEGASVQAAAGPQVTDAAEAEESEPVYDASLSGELASTLPPAGTQPARRVGSPFAASYRPVATQSPAAFAAPARGSPQPALYPRRPAAAGGAVASLVLGLMSLAASFFTVGALFLALVGLPMGIWGVSSERRGLAVVGLLLCCIALAISGFGAAALLYELRYGLSPWETPVSY